MNIPFNQETVQDTFLQDLRVDPVLGHLAPRINEPVVQQAIFRSVFKYSQVYEDDEGFFSYDIRQPYTPTIRQNYLLQEDSQFSEDWYNACDDYIASLSRRDLYILRRYTRHGDEIVNALLRQPDGFTTNKRVQTLFFEKMPDEQQMLYAMQLIDKYAEEDHDRYVTPTGDLIAVEYRDLQEMEQEYVGNVEGLDMPALLERVRPLIYEYIEDLRKILRQAPPLPGPLQVFRASGTDYLNRAYETAVVQGFMSTSLDSCIGEAFPQNDFVYQLILQPGVPCLSIKKASKYYAEFEVLVDTGCFANSSLLVGKHTLQPDIYSGQVDPDHILIEPQNMQHKTRTIQVMAEGQAGGFTATVRASKSKPGSKSHMSRKSKGKTVKKVMTRRSKSRATKRPTSRSSKFRRLMTWRNRDPLPPRIDYGKVPATIHKRLLEAHKKMGTDFHHIAR